MSEVLQRYTDERTKSQSPTVRYKLSRCYALLGDFSKAAETLAGGGLPQPQASLLRLDYLARSGERTSDLRYLVPRKSKKHYLRGMSILLRSVADEVDFNAYLSVAAEADTSLLSDPQYLSRLGNAARRAGRTRLAIGYLEEAVKCAALAPIKSGEAAATSGGSGSVLLADPWAVLDDLLSAVGPDRDELFAVAGTLLGLVREGGFIAHDYDMDFGVRKAEAHARIRDALRKDWRFELLLGRDPNVLKVQHINGTSVDVYLFRKVSDGWVKQTHVYGWHFEDFELTTADFSSRSVRIPDDAEGYLRQMYGDDWRIPQRGFDSRLHSPNGFFPNPDEIVCALLNKAVSAVRAGRQEQVDGYRRFLHERFQYEMPLPVSLTESGELWSSRPAEPSSTQAGFSNADAATRVRSDSSEPEPNHVAGTPSDKPDSGPQDAQGGGTKNEAPSLAQFGRADAEAAVLRVTARHKSRAHGPVRPASFRQKLDERIRIRRLLRGIPDTVSVTGVLVDKLKRDRLCRDMGLPMPAKLLEAGSLDEVAEFLKGSSDMVVKPVIGSGGRGVFPLRAVADGWLNVRTGERLSREEVVSTLQNVTIQGSPVANWSIEELVVGDSNSDGHPMDYKFYMFQDRVGLVLAKRHLPGTASHRWFTSEWQDAETGKHADSLDSELALPRQPDAAAELAATIATHLPTSFVRVDLIEGTNGMYLGELTPLPGRYHRFAKPADVFLGTVWELAAAENYVRYQTDERYAEAMKLVRELSGAETVVTD